MVRPGGGKTAVYDLTRNALGEAKKRGGELKPIPLRTLGRDTPNRADDRTAEKRGENLTQKIPAAYPMQSR